MALVLRSRTTLAWLILIVLTLVSWVLGTQTGAVDSAHFAASLFIFLVAIFKVRIIGLYFMDLREAPVGLRQLFDVYCAVLLVALSGVYLFG
ncbi:MAG: cytochrome C oxidase subunit IV family protein [Mycolicibacterium sp.]|uniref:Prokaryotic cytochrome C oxidase subunit IV family protein n=1 Tax=Mycolicibacterium insubricum TaxID=444597 RepID=A0A1X0DM50_9MYCO|nr:cytochrome C oxidase subunit IV family protein [Mycolicibacterium insubricum]MCB9439052.1 cytochrome C oxidase subunit IV family protein [Mycolicibacterium sp.]MCV7083189.1 cytochrome C oxidase subunit IV family protein [Mycolicibacterium insubricum]ORA73407.1 hypothetical protein BST26_02995 [Mycolicibacterium insubricum]